MLLAIIAACALGFFGAWWLDPRGRGKARWNYTQDDWNEHQ